MPDSEAFERLLQRALQTQDLPPIPVSIQNAWQRPRADSGAKWVWLLPAVVFVLGLAIGSQLAPLGLGSAFGSVRSAWSDIWRHLPDSALPWAGALLSGVLIIAMDSFRTAHRRRK